MNTKGTTPAVREAMLSSLSSLKLTTFLMVALCLLIFCGAWIPQNINEQELYVRFGDPQARTVVMLGLHRVFSSSLFLLVIGLLFVNLAACSVSRLRSRVTHRLMPGKGKSAGEIASMSHSISIDVSDSVDSRLYLVKFMKRVRRFSVIDNGLPAVNTALLLRRIIVSIILSEGAVADDMPQTER